ncbi:YkgB family protein [Pseudomonas sp. GCM10022186]|uniref:YkgB family protein n=1 Tax=Pseudomonas sp. GCM10022186 TaxID=3252650 RepID=UPI003614F2DB
MNILNITSHGNDTLSHNLSLGAITTAIGTYGAYFALAVIYFWFGGMKFTSYEAQGLVPLVSNSPLLGWLYGIFSVETFSNLLGVLEVSIGVLIAGRLLSPKLSLIGGVLSAGLFFTTLSFMFSTPGVIEPSLGFPGISVAPGQFLLKDLGLLAASIFVAGHSLTSMEAP